MKNYLDFKLNIFDEVTSTNDVLREMAISGAPDKTVVLASSQTKGRGRLGRSFFSPNGSGIYMSLLLRPQIDIADIPLITPLTAVVVCEAIEQIFSVSPQIKWVNDLLLNGKKICGILTEGAFTSDGKIDYIIVGIGINLNPPKDGFPSDIENIAGAVTCDYSEDKKEKLIEKILQIFDERIAKFSTKDFVSIYRKKSAVIGKDVTVILGESKISAKVLDISDNCELVVRYENGKTEALSSGEISVRL
ncbi:MAG: biotin--[Oscillospiraceae bacterium]|nr:biotin--[acetyl-CoA-carboxylase] ligase [Oscillospiraceae bacterium]